MAFALPKADSESGGVSYPGSEGPLTVFAAQTPMRRGDIADHISNIRYLIFDLSLFYTSPCPYTR